MPVITGIYGAIATLILLALALNVIRCRGKYKVSVGDGGNPDMLLAIRMHANAAEYIPVTIIMMLLFELTGGSAMSLQVAGGVLIVSRIAHAIGLSGITGPSLFRTIGIVGSFVAIGIPAIGILWMAVK